MSRTVSPSVRKPYGLALVCRVLEIPRSTVYAVRTRKASLDRAPSKRGPKTRWSDEALLGAIGEVLDESLFTGEGHRKVWARLRGKGIRTSKERVLRLMREAHLLAPTRVGPSRGPEVHDGTIIPRLPDEMWGEDFTSTVTTGEGTAYIFGVLDHATAECLALEAFARPTRLAAVDTLRQAVQERFETHGPLPVPRLKMRHDNGSAYTSALHQAELRHLGIESSPAFVRAPEGNGSIERFFRTLKEQLLWVRTFRTIEELRVALREFRDRYNNHWILERHGYLTPRAAREKLLGHDAA